jgi:hypothetical protein
MPEHIHPKSVGTALQPKTHDVEHRFDDFGVAPVEIGLIAKKGVVIILRVPGSYSQALRRPRIWRYATGAHRP